MQRSATVVVLLIVAALGAVAWRSGTFRDANDDPSLTLPPPLVAANDVGDRVAMFEGRDLSNWKIQGSQRTNEGTFVLGGDQAASATSTKLLAEGETLEFDFFQEGSAGSTLHLEPLLIHPQSPDQEFLHDIRYDLSVAGYVYKRWHYVVARAKREGTNTQMEIVITPHHDGPGRGGSSAHSLPARGGCQYRIAFETAPGAKLSLRNVFVRPATSPSP